MYKNLGFLNTKALDVTSTINSWKWFLHRNIILSFWEQRTCLWIWGWGAPYPLDGCGAPYDWYCAWTVEKVSTPKDANIYTNKKPKMRPPKFPSYPPIIGNKICDQNYFWIYQSYMHATFWQETSPQIFVTLATQNRRELARFSPCHLHLFSDPQSLYFSKHKSHHKKITSARNRSLSMFLGWASL